MASVGKLQIKITCTRDIVIQNCIDWLMATQLFRRFAFYSFPLCFCLFFWNEWVRCHFIMFELSKLYVCSPFLFIYTISAIFSLWLTASHLPFIRHIHSWGNNTQKWIGHSFDGSSCVGSNVFTWKFIYLFTSLELIYILNRRTKIVMKIWWNSLYLM